MTEQAKYIMTGFWEKYQALPKTEDLAKKFGISQQEAEDWKVQFKSSVSAGQSSAGTLKTSTTSQEPTPEAPSVRTRRSSKRSTSEKEPSPSPTPEKMEKSESKPSHFDWHSLLTVGIVKSLWSIFALFCMYRSFDYVFSWFSRMDSFFNAVVAAILCAGATFLLPTTSILDIRAKGRLSATSIGMGFLFAIFMIVTVNSTVGSLYETRRALESGLEKTAISNDQSKARIAQLEKMIEQATEDKKALAAELAQRLEVQKPFPVGSKEYDRLAGNINTVKTRQDRNSALLAGYQDELGKLTASTVAVKQRASYASWWDNLLGWAPGTFDLVFGMAFAIALDISGPVALLISFFLGDKREDENRPTSNP